jgi:hypothetical protein
VGEVECCGAVALVVVFIVVVIMHLSQVISCVHCREGEVQKNNRYMYCGT